MVPAQDQKQDEPAKDDLMVKARLWSPRAWLRGGLVGLLVGMPIGASLSGFPNPLKHFDTAEGGLLAVFGFFAFCALVGYLVSRYLKPVEHEALGRAAWWARRVRAGPARVLRIAGLSLLGLGLAAILSLMAFNWPSPLLGMSVFLAGATAILPAAFAERPPRVNDEVWGSLTERSRGSDDAAV